MGLASYAFRQAPNVLFSALGAWARANNRPPDNVITHRELVPYIDELGFFPYRGDIAYYDCAAWYQARYKLDHVDSCILVLAIRSWFDTHGKDAVARPRVRELERIMCAMYPGGEWKLAGYGPGTLCQHSPAQHFAITMSTTSGLSHPDQIYILRVFRELGIEHYHDVYWPFQQWRRKHPYPTTPPTIDELYEMRMYCCGAPWVVNLKRFREANPPCTSMVCE